MKRNFLTWWLFVFCLLVSSLSFATSSNHFANNATHEGITHPPLSTTCISAMFQKTGNDWWSKIDLTLTNNCGRTVDFQGAIITFKNSIPINTNFWGDFGSIRYPDSPMFIITQPDPTGGYLATFKQLHIPEDGNSKLANNASIVLHFGVEKAGYNAQSVEVTLPKDEPTGTGQINLVNQTAKPANVQQNYAVVDVKLNGQTIKTVQLPWLGTQQLPGLVAGSYTIHPNNLVDTQNNSYQGSATPAAISLASGQTVTSKIRYTLLTQFGKIHIQVQALPNELSGYTNNPVVELTQIDNGSTTSKTVNWNTTTTIDQLVHLANYRFATSDITFNNYRCSGSFTPTQATSNASTPPTVRLTYTCVQINQVNVPLQVSGLTSDTPSVDVTFTPNNNATPVTKRVNLTNGSGSDVVNLTQGLIYNVSATAVSGFTASFNPQPLVAASNVTERVTYTAAPPPTNGGRIIGYIPGWKQPPSATSLASAGYTHMLVAFGVFSTSQPGKITPAFDTVTAAYINELHQAGLKVILSLGGALTSLPNTSVDFHQVLSMASSPLVFQQTFVQSVKDLADQYGFDGIDIDIEQGLNGGGTFQNPTGDIRVLANILNQLHADRPNFLITMAPQAANISATSGFDATWGNYASLIMQTYNAITWVGVQLYNTGCMYGIDHVCYDPNETSSPNFSVAMATDLLADWPQVDSTGRPTGFQPYVSHLRADQVVLGYPSPDTQGNSDGRPVTPTSTIKRAIQCLKTGVAGPNSCGTYVPPRAYGLIGGAFNWEVTYDQNNQFKFATDLRTCITTGVCT